MGLKIEIVIQQAIKAHKAGNLKDAEALYRAILLTHPRHPDANHNLGVLAVSLNNLGVAIPFLKIALESNPNHGQFWLSYIDALIKDKQFDTARGILEQGKKRGLTGHRVEALDAQLTPINFFQVPNSSKDTRSQIYTKKLRETSSKNGPNKYYSKIQRNLSIPDTNILLEHYLKGQYNLAEELAFAITKNYPSHQFSWKILGLLLKQKGRLHDSLCANQKAVALVPTDAESHSNLGLTLHALGNYIEAEASHRRAIELKPDLAGAHSNLGNTLLEVGRFEDAEKSYRTAIALQPDFPEAYSNLGLTLYGLCKFKEAEKSYRISIALKPDFAEAHSNLGNTLQYLGRLTDAEASCRKAIELNPDYTQAYSNLGIALQKLGRLEEAEANYRTAIALKPDFAEAHSNLGTTLQKLGKLEDAEVSCRTAIALNSSFAHAYCNLGVTLKKLGRLEDAVKSYRTAIELIPDFIETFYNLSTALIFLNKISEAVEVLEEIILIDPNNFGLKAAVDLSIIKFLDNELSKSQTLLIESSAIFNKESLEFKNQIIYWTYLNRLLDWHHTSTQDRSFCYKYKKLFVIGESHSLVSHGIHIDNNDEKFLCKAFWIVGCKQWHLGSLKNNEYKHKFEQVINSLPASSDILLSFGEIDCRLNNGILKYNKKMLSKNIDGIISETVNNYLIT
jgi:tetratricopeptide (TPR) repeat protein